MLGGKETNKRKLRTYFILYATFSFNGKEETRGRECAFEKEEDEYRLLGLDRARTTEAYLKRDAKYIDEERAGKGKKIIEVYHQEAQRGQEGDEQTGCEESETKKLRNEGKSREESRDAKTQRRVPIHSRNTYQIISTRPNPYPQMQKYPDGCVDGFTTCEFPQHPVHKRRVKKLRKKLDNRKTKTGNERGRREGGKGETCRAIRKIQKQWAV